MRIAKHGLALTLTTLTSLALLGYRVADGACNGYRERPEIHDMTPSEILKYVDGVKKLHSIMHSNGRYSLYERMAYEHALYNGVNHNLARFLPYHRMMVYSFENLLRQYVDPNMVVPYWNWTIHAQEPWNDPIVSLTYFGDTNRTNCNDLGCCMTTGNFGAWKYQDGSCVRRKFTYGERNGQDVVFFWRSVQTLVINSNRNYQDFESMVELLHGNMHGWVGGTMANVAWSPMDPLFYLHHAFVDQIWSTWQKTYDTQFTNYNGVQRSGAAATVDEIIVPYNVPVSSLLDQESELCVRYLPTRNLNMQPAPVNSDISAPDMNQNPMINMTGWTQEQKDAFFRDLANDRDNISKDIDNAIKDGKTFVDGVGPVGVKSFGLRLEHNMYLTTMIAVLAMIWLM